VDFALASGLSRGAIQAVHLGARGLAEVLLERLAQLVADHRMADPATQGALHHARAVWLLYTGDFAASAHIAERAVLSYLQIGDLPSACLERANLSNCYMELGAYAEAEHTSREALAASQELDLVRPGFAAAINLGYAVAEQGRLDEAIAIERDVVARLAEGTEPRFESAARLYLAYALQKAGRHVEAERQAARAVELAERIPPLRAYALAMHARALTACGEPGRALEAGRRAAELLESLGGVDSGEGFIRLVHVEVLFASGAQAEALSAIAQARAWLVARASKIGDLAWRARFLSAVPENAQTMALAERWLASAPVPG
jgi:tetratricopeptide (TPR) repeat protein